MNKKTLIDILLLCALLIMVAVGYKLSPLLLPESTRQIVPPLDCPLSHCEVSLGENAHLTFQLPEPVPFSTPFTVHVKTTGISVKSMVIDFAGVGMNMGLIRPRLSLVGEGIFETEVVLPVCITGDMTWRTTLLIETATERIAIPFLFSSGKTGGKHSPNHHGI